ncbi:MAG: hypothetical protein PW999_16090 [Paraburkholderia tropica]|nr:hypothetical protein [Paraburkholderia tropica]
MHRASSYINSEFPDKSELKPLSSTQARSLRYALNEDALSYIYSGAISLAEAITGTDNSAFSWSAVKAYYSTFYMLRALLALEGWAILYRGSKPFIAEARSGAEIRKSKGNTHEIVLETFSGKFPSHWLLSQEISSEQPLEWMRHRREEANYNRARFIEPDVPAPFKEIKSLGIRKAIGAYYADTYYAFDPDHSILAYPIATLRHTLDRLSTTTSFIAPDDARFISTLCKDKDGPIVTFSSLLAPR